MEEHDKGCMPFLSTYKTYSVTWEKPFKGEFAGNENSSMSKYEQKPGKPLRINHLAPQGDEAEPLD